MKFNININFANLKGEGFAAFIKDSLNNTGIVQIIIDLNAMLNCCSEHPEMGFKDFFKENVLHEILHGVEELFNKSFDEDRIELAIIQSRETEQKQFTDYELKIMENISNLISETYFEGELTISQIKTIADKVFTDSLNAVNLVSKLNKKRYERI